MVVATYLVGKLMYLLRDIALLMLVAGFVAMLLNPAVARVQRRIPRRGLAVTIVTLWAALVFIALAALVGYAQALSKPALTVGKGAVSVIIELFTLFALVLLLLLEGAKIWTWYMFGNLLTSLIVGTMVFVTLLVLGVPFPLLRACGWHWWTSCP